MDEYIVLVDDNNNVLGTAPKIEAHNGETPLHRGFSLFLFNEYGELLIQQRSHQKKTWPLVWSNSCCGHPKLDELPIAAAKRRLDFELGITQVDIKILLPDYKYTCKKDGIVENEICPVMVGFTAQRPAINTDEIEAIHWIQWDKWVNEVIKNPKKYSPWSTEETQLLEKSTVFHSFLKNGTR